MDLIVRTLGEETPAVFHDTLIEFKETKRFLYGMVESYGLTDFTITKPTAKGTFIHQLRQRDALTLKNHGHRAGLYTIANIRPCCNTLKKHPGKRHNKARGIELTFTGVRRAESKNRDKIYRCAITKFKDGFSATPLREWSTEDIQEYIANRMLKNIGECSLYKIHRGLGCAVCPCPNKARDYYGLLYEHHPQWYKFIYRFRPTAEPKFYKHTWREL